MSRDGTATKDAEFSAWMSARQPALMRTAYLLTGDHHSAEDLVQTDARQGLPVVGQGAEARRGRRLRPADPGQREQLVWRRAWKKREVSSDEVPERQAVHDRYDEGQSAALWEHVQTLPRKQRR